MDPKALQQIQTLLQNELRKQEKRLATKDDLKTEMEKLKKELITKIEDSEAEIIEILDKNKADKIDLLALTKRVARLE